MVDEREAFSVTTVSPEGRVVTEEMLPIFGAGHIVGTLQLVLKYLLACETEDYWMKRVYDDRDNDDGSTTPTPNRRRRI